MNRSFLSDKYESSDIKVRLFLFLVDILGSVLFWPVRVLARRRPGYDPSKVKKILVLRLDGIGDLVLSSAALREIRQGFAQAEITLAVASWAREIAGCIPFYDRLIVHDSILFARFRGKRAGIGSELRFCRELRKEKYDLGIDLRGDLFTIIPLFLSGARFRFATGTWGGGFLLTHRVSWDAARPEHQKEKALYTARAVGVLVTNNDTELRIPRQDAEYVEHCLAEKGVKPSERIVAIAPCAIYYWKSWRAERFVQVATQIAAQYDSRVVLIGSRADSKAVERVADLAGCGAVNTAGELTLSQVAALIHRSAVFIGNDSGLIHMAAALKTPMIQIFGPGEPERFGYAGTSNILLVSNTCPYHPCAQRRCSNQDNWCMDAISVDDVMAAFRSITKKRSK